MAGSSLFVLIDDIATLLDDVATMTKVATKKTASVLGDDLAVNAEQVSGVRADRELPVVWAVAKGSFKNKFILVPSALAISAFIPWLIIPLLVFGGLFLCFEGFEKVWHHFAHKQENKEHHQQLVAAVSDNKTNMLEYEQKKIHGAIRTDLILSAEIIVISLGVVSSQPFITQVGTLVTIAILITVGVYGLVAGIVKLDDAGLYLSRKESILQQKLGLWIVTIAPYLMKGLSIFGTIAMFMVGGGIISHNITVVHHLSQSISTFLSSAGSIGGILSAISPILFDMILGLLLGALVLIAVSLFQKIFLKKTH
jgi:predicted DNA repair protein MutK